MTFDQLIKRPAPWLVSSSKNTDVVLTSRIRIVRNLTDSPFPGWANTEQNVKSLNRLLPLIESLEAFNNGMVGDASQIEEMHKMMLAERRLISSELATRTEGCGIAVTRNQTVCVLINEEEHLKIQAFMPGLQLRKAYLLAAPIETELAGKVNFAFKDGLGYLTSCPHEAGSGVKASVILHLPGCSYANYMEAITRATQKLGLTLKGIYDDGAETHGCLYQLANKNDIQSTPHQIIEKVHRTTAALAAQELNIRKKIFQDTPHSILDVIGKSYGILKFARLLKFEEAINHISNIRLGIYLKVFPDHFLKQLNLLTILINPIHICQAIITGNHNGETTFKGPYKKNQVAEAVSSQRADIIREYFQNFPDPIIL